MIRCSFNSSLVEQRVKLTRQKLSLFCFVLGFFCPAVVFLWSDALKTWNRTFDARVNLQLWRLLFLFPCWSSLSVLSDLSSHRFVFSSCCFPIKKRLQFCLPECNWKKPLTVPDPRGEEEEEEEEEEGRHILEHLTSPWGRCCRGEI